MITAAIEVDQQRDVMTADIPNAFVQTDLVSDNWERMIMKIKGQLTDMNIQIDTKTYANYVVQEENVYILNLELRRADAPEIISILQEIAPGSWRDRIQSECPQSMYNNLISERKTIDYSMACQWN